MSLNRQKTSNQTVSPARIFDDPPEMPDEPSRSKFAEYARRHAAWWAKHKATLTAMASDIRSLQEKQNAAEGS